MGPILPLWLGRVPYADALALQELCVRARLAGLIPDTLLLLEHPSVLTLGRGASMGDVLITSDERGQRGVELFETGRGGHVTAHGPGQLVAYPIFDLRPDRCDVRRYIHDLGEVMVRLARDYGVAAHMVKEPALHIGVWVGEGPESKKLGAIGVRLSRWVTMHGFAFNVSTDLSLFDLIVPCGMPGAKATSLRAERGDAPAVVETLPGCVAHVAAVFGAEAQALERVEDLMGYTESLRARVEAYEGVEAGGVP
jgi:lipoyl(octanoyl) transferase